MKTLVAFTGLVAGILGLSTPGSAWSDTGQETACYIAYAEMKPETRAKVEALIPGGADAFAKACTWAPEHWLKQQRKAYDYVNVPRDMDALTGTDCPQGKRCLLSAIAQDSAALTAEDTSQKDRARALMRLGYYVGRLHQPLAVGFRNDNTGTLIYTAGLSYCKGSLQHLWADCMVDYAMMLEGAKTAAGFAEKLEAGIGADKRAEWRQDATPAVWATESLKIVTEPAFGYCIPGDGGCRYQKNRLNFRFDSRFPSRLPRIDRHLNENFVNRQLTSRGVVSSTGPMPERKPTVNVKTLKLDETYISHFAPLVGYRLKQAGVRLAALLDNVLADDDEAVSGGAPSR